MSQTYDVFRRIGENPGAYLPSVSLESLHIYMGAYSARTEEMPGGASLAARMAGFQTWLDRSLGIQSGPRSVFHVVAYYAVDETDALRTFFQLFAQFESETPTMPEPAASVPHVVSHIDLPELLRRIRMRPAMYISYPHLLGIRCYLAGHMQAGRDSRLAMSEGEALFSEFTQWVESDMVEGNLQRPWHQIISFRSFHDCGTGPASAYTVFFDALDKFAEGTGRTGMFCIPSS